MIQRVTKYGEPVLKQVAQKIENFDQELKTLADTLFDTMCKENGLGLAAPQIDVSKRIFVIDMRRRINQDCPCNFTIDGKQLPLEIAMPLYAVNPVVEEIGDYVEIAEEGCLSFPGIYAEVERSAQVKLTYQDLQGNQHVLICEGLFARCVQHENDHLDGTCFIDRLEPKELFKVATKLRKLKKQTKDFLKRKE